MSGPMMRCPAGNDGADHRIAGVPSGRFGLIADPLSDENICARCEIAHMPADRLKIIIGNGLVTSEGSCGSGNVSCYSPLSGPSGSGISFG